MRKFFNPRFYMHILRRILLKILFGNSSKGFSKDLVSDMFSQRLDILTDRIGILESNVNWRLYGLPPKIANLKLEQAKLLAGSGDVEKSISLFKKSSQKKYPIDVWGFFHVLPAISNEGTGSALFFENFEFSEIELWLKECKTQNHIFVISDTSDLYYTQNQLNPVITHIHSSAISSLALLSEPRFSFLSLSTYLERATPLQAQIVLCRIFNGLLPKGVAVGFFDDYDKADKGAYWLDVRKLRPMTQAVVSQLAKNAGFEKIEFFSHEQGSLSGFKITR